MTAPDVREDRPSIPRLLWTLAALKVNRAGWPGAYIAGLMLYGLRTGHRRWRARRA